MPTSRSRESWELPESAATPESVYWNRRRFLKALGLGGLTAAGLSWGAHRLGSSPGDQGDAWGGQPKLAARKHPDYQDAGRPVTAGELPIRFNNFYEFTTDQERVWRVARGFRLDPYELEVGGLVERPGKLSLGQIERLGLEERVYRFRCVEAWAMTVPWTGVPLAKLLAHVGVQAQARYVAFQSFLDPDQAPGQREGDRRWPYYEALNLREALHELTLVVTGIYGRRLPPQSGAPLRIVVPWKYGFKSPKSVVRITLTEKRPPTFWNDAADREYSWLSNVEPDVPHPRWSQKTEEILGGGERPSELYNGYAEQVAHLYRD